MPTQPRLFDHLWFCVAGGAIAGLLEAVVLLFKRFALGKVIWTTPEVIWMAPLVYGLAGFAPGFILAAVSWRWPRVVSANVVAIATIAGVILVALMSILGGTISFAAQALIATGVAVQVARALTSDLDRRSYLARRVVIVAGGGVAVVAALMGAAMTVRERYAARFLPEAPRDGRNVLFIVWDTVRGESLSLTGYARRTTPFLEQWASRGVVFERAIAPSAWTLPSHGSFFTGALTQELSLNWNRPLTSGPATVAELLSARGFRTGAFVANLVQATRESGLARGFGVYQDYERTPRHILASTVLGQRLDQLHPIARADGKHYRKKDARTVTEQFLGWLDRSDDRPFFAFLNYFNAHNPYDAPAPLLAEFAHPNPKIRGYDAGIAYQDREFDRLLRELERRGMLDRTTVVLVSDHGELFGEHGLEQHGNSLYRPLIEVPFMVIAPGKVPGGRRITATVSLRDVAATLVDQALGEHGTVPGKSLARYWTSSTPLPSDTAISGIQAGINAPKNEPITKGPMSSVVVDDWHYILVGDGSRELFNWRTDPAELTNLAADPTFASIADSLDAVLRRRIPASWLPNDR